MLETSSERRATRQPKAEREAAILEAARREFEEKGYDGAKVADIAKRVGVVEGTIFHYFRNKRALVVSVMENFYADITTEQEIGLSRVQGARNRLHYIIRHHLEVMTKNADLCGVLLRESRIRDDCPTNNAKPIRASLTVSEVKMIASPNGAVKLCLGVSVIVWQVDGGIQCSDENRSQVASTLHDRPVDWARCIWRAWKPARCWRRIR